MRRGGPSAVVQPRSSPVMSQAMTYLYPEERSESDLDTAHFYPHSSAATISPQRWKLP
jgi:hypothetical protein